MCTIKKETWTNTHTHNTHAHKPLQLGVFQSNDIAKQIIFTQNKKYIISHLYLYLVFIGHQLGQVSSNFRIALNFIRVFPLNWLCLNASPNTQCVFLCYFHIIIGTKKTNKMRLAVLQICWLPWLVLHNLSTLIIIIFYFLGYFHTNFNIFV